MNKKSVLCVDMQRYKEYENIDLSQASDDASLRSLEALMNEFFSGTTDNHRKREIGEYILHVLCITSPLSGIIRQLIRIETAFKQDSR